jgi:hypothetical protein
VEHHEEPAADAGRPPRPISPGGVALCAACARRGGCRLGLREWTHFARFRTWLAEQDAAS